MIKIIPVSPVGFAANSYLLTADSKRAVLIDAAGEWTLAAAKKAGLTVTHVLLTHGHFDHIGGAKKAQEEGAKIGCHFLEQEVISRYSLFEEMGAYVRPFRPDFTFGEEILRLNGMEISVLFTPGHTQGGVTFAVEDNLFTGDTLFRGSVGRTDFPTGNAETLKRSVKKLYALKGDYQVFPGHEGQTTLEWERKHNYYVREDLC